MEALLLAQENAVDGELGAYQLGHDLILQCPQTLLRACRQLDEYGAVHQRLPVAVHGGDERRHILQIGLGSDSHLEIGGARLVHTVFVGSVVENLAFLGGSDLPGIDRERHAALVAQMPEKRQLLGAGGIAPQGEHRAVGVAENVMVSIELHRAGGDDVEEVLGDELRLLLFGRYRRQLHGKCGFLRHGWDGLLFLLLRFLTRRFLHRLSPRFLRRRIQSIRSLHPAGSRQPADA